MEALYAALRFFQTGGLFMYPIAFILAIGVAIIVERYAYLTVVGIANRRTWKRILPLVQDGKYEVAGELVAQSNNAMSKIFGYGLQRAGSGGKGEDVQLAMEEGVLEFIPRLEKRTHYLATFANIATLLGLLGTIMGLIEAFSAVAGAGHELTAPASGDFLVDNTFVYEVGGRNKGLSQIRRQREAYLALDDMETGINKKIPLWMFGLLY